MTRFNADDERRKELENYQADIRRKRLLDNSMNGLIEANRIADEKAKAAAALKARTAQRPFDMSNPTDAHEFEQGMQLERLHEMQGDGMAPNLKMQLADFRLRRGPQVKTKTREGDPDSIVNLARDVAELTDAFESTPAGWDREMIEIRLRTARGKLAHSVAMEGAS